MDKPPIGVMPKYLYEFKRIQDLCRALYEYTAYTDCNYDLLTGWSKELTERIESLKKEQDSNEKR